MLVAVVVGICSWRSIGLTFLGVTIGWKLRYLIAINCVAAVLNCVDKGAAKARARRVPELLLLAVELLGGVPGALATQNLIRHKTAKRSFQTARAVVLASQMAVLVFWR